MNRDIMRKIWPSIVPFVVLTAVAVALLIAAVKLLKPNLGLAPTILLLAGGVFAIAIMVYVVFRWVKKQLSSDKISYAVTTLVGLLSATSRGDRAAVRQSVDETTKVVSHLRPLVKISLGFLLFNTVFLELLAIGNAAAIYLQSERLDEQNSLLEKQNDLLDSQNIRMDSQTIIAKYQILSELSGFVGKSHSLLKDLSNSAIEMIQYEKIIENIVDNFPRFRNIPVDKCASMKGCKRIDSIDSSLVGMYLTSVRIRRSYEELSVLFSGPEGRTKQSIEQESQLRTMLYELVYVCGLLHDPGLTKHDNRWLFSLGDDIIAVSFHSDRIIEAWDTDDIPVDMRLESTRSNFGFLKDRLKQSRLNQSRVPVGGAEPKLSEDVGTMFAHSLAVFKDLMEDLGTQCVGKRKLSYDATHKLLAEFNAKSFDFIHMLMRGGLSAIEMPTLFEYSIADAYKSTRDKVGDETVVMGSGVRVGPWPADLESD